MGHQMIEKKYRLADKRPVRVICTNRKHADYPLVTLVENEDEEVIASYTTDGFYCASKVDHYMNLIEITKWDDFEVDEPVMVQDEDSPSWRKRYFAGVSKTGKPMVWDGGHTSWLADYTTEWDYCRRPTKEELSK